MINIENSFDTGVNWRFPNARNYGFAFIFLFLFLILIYGNSFECEWQFDDSPNIVNNTNVHFKSLSWEEIKKSFHVAASPHSLPRPVAYLSFGLNYYSGGLDVFGYHVVNLSIHMVASAFLFLFIYNTLNLPLLKEKYGSIAYPVSLLAVTLWATSPLQVNAVTYIVQRMTSLSGTAYIMSMYFYLKGRTTIRGPARGAMFFALCAVFALVSFGSKENAAMLPLSIFLYDLFLIQGVTGRTLKKNLLILAIPLLILATLGSFYLNYSSLMFIDYSHWTFTLKERLLTEPRVILYYVSLLLYPVSSRLAIDHDIAVSRSLFDPPGTFFAILVIILSAGYALYSSGKRPLLAYCVIFFLINHAIEGSFVALDLAFEHRNYLPSMFFFVPVAVFIVKILDHFAYKKTLQFLVAAAVVFVVAAQAHTVHFRNELFRYEKLLWEDNVRKMPYLSRPRGALAKALFDEGDYEGGVREGMKALSLANYPNYMQPALYNSNIGNYFLIIKKDAQKALSYYGESLRHQPKLPVAHYGVAMAMLKKGSLDAAYENIRQAIRYKPGDRIFHYALALVHLKRGDYDEAIREADRSAKLGYRDGPLAVKAEAMRLKGNPSGAIIYWEKFVDHNPGDLMARLALVELYAGSNKKEKLVRAIGAVLFLKGKRTLGAVIDEMAGQKDGIYIPVKSVILPIVERGLASGY